MAYVTKKYSLLHLEQESTGKAIPTYYLNTDQTFHSKVKSKSNVRLGDLLNYQIVFYEVF